MRPWVGSDGAGGPADPVEHASAFPHFALGSAPPKLVGQTLAFRGKGKRDGVDAIALPDRRRAVWKDMSLMRTASGANDFRSDHAIAGVANVAEMIRGEGRSETRPSSATLELRTRPEQWQAAQPARINSLPLLGEENSAKRRFRPMLEQNLPLVLAKIPGQLPQLLLARRCQIELQVSDVAHFPSP